MLNIKELLEEIKASPYEEVEISVPHTGKVEFADLKVGDKVSGPSGEWKEKPGTVLAKLTRERNTKNIPAPEKGEIVSIRHDLEGKFVEAGEVLLKIRHFLSKEEVIQLILKKALFLFNAPEKAKYYFTPEIDTKIKGSGERSVKVREGLELFIVSRMKRETPLNYAGPEGLIYAVYFHNGDNVDAGQALIGVCPADQLKHIQEVVNRVQSEWEERD
ncbi:biotin attachment protein [Maridesulfovibrio ferrireducens]|uniref:biotin attachment protein n=1 Tax=Maridesulfovibrio ferrireducens TaxID=246191 RepID=UPI001A3549D6|nr:biotin attachment protein [Maridesulfovibrio ferrireducens]MBI9112461.1 biotin attachment protein [Maridesulfovibrio ferrireducens]